MAPPPVGVLATPGGVRVLVRAVLQPSILFTFWQLLIDDEIAVLSLSIIRHSRNACVGLLAGPSLFFVKLFNVTTTWVRVLFCNGKEGRGDLLAFSEGCVI